MSEKCKKLKCFSVIKCTVFHNSLLQIANNPLFPTLLNFNLQICFTKLYSFTVRLQHVWLRFHPSGMGQRGIHSLCRSYVQARPGQDGVLGFP